MKLLAALAALVTVSTAAFAEPAPVAEEVAAPVFTVLEADASLSFSTRNLRSYQVARDDSLILRVGANRWYRATVWEPCARDLKWERNIAFDTGPGDTLDRFSSVVVDGNRCPIETLDQIERPAPDVTE